MPETRVAFEFDIVRHGINEVAIHGFMRIADGSRQRVVLLRGQGNPIDALARVLAELSQTVAATMQESRFLPMSLWGFKKALFKEVLREEPEKSDSQEGA